MRQISNHCHGVAVKGSLALSAKVVNIFHQIIFFSGLSRSQGETDELRYALPQKGTTVIKYKI